MMVLHIKFRIIVGVTEILNGAGKMEHRVDGDIEYDRVTGKC